jgi:glycosyltransferase involved in cell wall biosynthesis
MNKPLVTIVIPVYNGNNFLRKAIDSALAQTWDAVEIIVVNDGSTDAGATESIAISYGPKIRYFSQPNGGVASALNAGISNMRGQYFSWLSHDDEYLPHKIETQLRFLGAQDQKNAIAYSDFELIDADSRSLGTCIMPKIGASEFRLWITRESLLHGCSLLIPRECFDCCGRFDTNLKTTQDYAMWFAMAKHYPFLGVPHVLVRARIHEGQGTRQMKGIVRDECDSMHASFVDDLMTSELAHPMAALRRAEHLVRLATSFRKRRFSLSYASTRKRALEEGRRAGIRGFVATVVGLLEVRRFRRMWKRAGKAARRLTKRIVSKIADCMRMPREDSTESKEFVERNNE